MSAVAVEIVEEGFIRRLTPDQQQGLESACRARGARIDWQRGWITLRGRFLNGLCADLPLPCGLHLTRNGVTEPPPAGMTTFRVEILT